jgi:hypothetical protein
MVYIAGIIQKSKKMKTTIYFIGFTLASILAGIGCENQNNLALIAGCVFMVLIIILVFSDAKETVKS